MNGFINLLKPTGLTSHSAVSAVKRITKADKVGHTGTLDPMAAGVLPICLGSATRMTEYMDTEFKKYRCELCLGITTDTQDIWGEVLLEKAVSVKPEEIETAFQGFLGKIQQIPPAYSAVRVNGKRLYEYARQGEIVEVKSREVTIKELNILKITGNKVLFDVECSKGTYIRTICHDIGQMLGCGGTMSFLVRMASGKFAIENTVTFEELQEHGIEPYLHGIDYPIDMLGSVHFTQKEQGDVFCNGGWVRLEHVIMEEGTVKGFYKVYCLDTFIAIGIINEQTNQILPHKVFVRGLSNGNI